MRDAHLLGLALLAALAPACKKAAPDGVTNEPPMRVESGEAPDVQTSGGVVTTTPDPGTLPPASDKDCATAPLPGQANAHMVQFEDGTRETVHGMSADAWKVASERLLTECKARGPEASCEGGLMPPSELICRASAFGPRSQPCSATLRNQQIYRKVRTEGLAWNLSCGWVELQIDPRTGEQLSRSEIMEGRPLMGEHGAVLPEICGTDDPLARHWLTMAAAELASVHSFERHLAELRSLSAPAELLEAVKSAALDEARHAALCIELAGEGSLGPMPATPAPRQGALAILRAVLVEACVNETVAALVVRRSASTCQQADRAAVLQAIADDEQRHAALAWRTLAWGLRTFPELRETLEAELHRAVAQVDVRAADVVGDGILTEVETQRAVQDAIVLAVLPAWSACGESYTRSQAILSGCLPSGLGKSVSGATSSAD